MASSSVSCSLCSVALPNACDRRLLHSAASSPVLNTVRGVATELFFCDVDEVFPPGSHLCRVCINRAVEKLSTLRQRLSVPYACETVRVHAKDKNVDA